MKLSWIADAFGRASEIHMVDCVEPHMLARENAAIQLQDQWSSFCRDVIVSSWRGGVVTLSGQYLAPRIGAKSESDALSDLRATYTGRLKKSARWEPRWFDPNEAIDAARRLALPNFASVSAGIGLTPSPLDELRAVRNYFAHRCRGTSEKLRPYLTCQVSTGAAHYTFAPRHSAAHFFSSGGPPSWTRWLEQPWPRAGCARTAPMAPIRSLPQSAHCVTALNPSSSASRRRVV